MPRELKGKRVLIVDDVVSSGDTLELATALARKVGAREVNTASLVARPGGFVRASARCPPTRSSSSRGLRGRHRGRTLRRGPDKAGA